MDDQYFQWAIILLLGLILIMVVVQPQKMISDDKDQSAIQFIYEQCMNETNINITFSTGQMYLAKENNVCILRGQNGRK